MKNILLTVSYDGTDFCGWQRQDKSDKGNAVRTVQGEIETVLKKMLKSDIALTGSGRTDSGVHAFGQAANFISPYDSIPAPSYVKALNGYLPKDIRIMDAEEVPMEFSSRFNATSRVYRYFMQVETPPFAKDSRFVWYIKHRPNLQNLKEMAHVLHGEMNFKTFAAAGDVSLSFNRYIDNCDFYYDENNPSLLVFEIEANAFLWKMVRSLTGTFIDLDKKGFGKDDFARILNAQERSLAGPTAPPEGLFLYKIKFDGIRRHV